MRPCKPAAENVEIIWHRHRTHLTHSLTSVLLKVFWPSSWRTLSQSVEDMVTQKPMVSGGQWCFSDEESPSGSPSGALVLHGRSLGRTPLSHMSLAARVSAGLCWLMLSGRSGTVGSKSHMCWQAPLGHVGGRQAWRVRPNMANSTAAAECHLLADFWTCTGQKQKQIGCQEVCEDKWSRFANALCNDSTSFMTPASTVSSLMSLPPRPFLPTVRPAVRSCERGWC